MEREYFVLEKFQYSFSTVAKVLNHESKIQWRSEDLFFKTITNSSQEAKLGSLFVPLLSNRDGHEFIKDALKRGASGFLANRKSEFLKLLKPAELEKGILVDNTWKALADLSRFHRMRFCPFIIGITGSSGKTTTKELLANCFNHISKTRMVVTEKNYNNEIGVPFTLFRINQKTEIAIIEMGMNHRYEIQRLTEMARPDWCLITNIGSAHIENLKSPESIAQEKTDILIGMPSGGRLYIPENILYPEIVESKTKQYQINPVFWKIQSASLKVVKKLPNGFDLEWDGIPFHWASPGEKILSNLSGVLRLAADAGLDKEILVSNIQKFKPSKGRLVLHKRKFTIIDDTYNANPESMESSISVANQLSDGKDFVCILGDMKELGTHSEKYHKQIAKFISTQNVKWLVGFGKDAAFFNPNLVEKKSKTSFLHCVDSDGSIDQMVQELVKTIPAKTVILVKGSRSMKMERIVEKILVS